MTGQRLLWRLLTPIRSFVSRRKGMLALAQRLFVRFPPLQRAFLELERRRRAELCIPRGMPPNPGFLRTFPGEAALPVEIRDARLLADAVAWAERRGPTAAPQQANGDRRERSVPRRRTLANILLISHCDFSGNSALHVYAIASELHARGLSPVMAVPDNAKSVEDIGRPSFPVLTYRDVRSGRLSFPDGRAPDLVHAFTPRELVRKLTAQIVRKHGCPYVVHLEDNEEAILSAELGGASIEELELLPAPVLDTIVGPSHSHPLRASRFLDHAAGVTVVIDRLLDFKPRHVSGAVVRAGFDEAVLSPSRSRDEVRAELGLHPDELAIVYTGSVHLTNVDDMRSLYAAVAALRRDGYPVVLVKTGWNSAEAAELPQLGEGLRDLGWVPRASVPPLIAAADVLVQPGAPGPFNDYRFPSKVPDFLASGRPVVLPRTNIGLDLRDGHEAIVLENGSADEICRAVALLRANPELATRIGEQGRAFALRKLSWRRSVDSVETLYREIGASGDRAEPTWTLDLDPPVKLVALVSSAPSAEEARVARAHGIFGFCLPAKSGLIAPAAPGAADFPFCFRIERADDEAIRSTLSELSNPGYIRIHSAPLLLTDDPAAAERCRGLAEDEAGAPVDFALIQDSSEVSSSKRGFDSFVEMPSPPTDAAMREHLALPLPDYAWFRSIAFPARRASRSVYATWLRKLVLQTLCCTEAQEPLIFVDARGAWPAPDAWLAATRSALRDGIGQFYSSRHLDVDPSHIEYTLRLG